ncbi:S8 family serine peptidase [Streptomyces zagrosensis]|uniref:Subtilisin family serine protease n=1 Tax=Streptomyces zagrosensis TaxID=1042984 RepID=A0A7W9V1W0_9ACTN|nr:S8 family serine peptidase [Streptomyces zagrosensis]MBB5939708.1 subtilisin family serine protease [Streptomyces zagrosensis]
MRRARIPRLRAAGALTAATLLTAAGPPAALAAEPVELPVLRSTLTSDEPCVRASTIRAKAQPWTVPALGLPRAWSLSQGSGVTVAVVDTGVGRDVAALVGRVEAVDGADEDCVGHGSFAAGLIAAARLDGVGPAGVAPQSRILAVRGTDARGVPTPQRLADGIREAADGGARIIYVGYALPTGKAELTAAVAHASTRDALVIAPAFPDPVSRERGKPDVPVPTTPWYWPAAVPGVVAVGSYGLDGASPARAPQPPRVARIDLVAPGDAVVSVGPSGSGHFLGSGASLAAAQVAGAAALVRAQRPELTAPQAVRQLTAAAYPASPPRLDPYAAMTAVLGEERPTVPHPAAARVPEPGSRAPRDRALIVAAAGGGLVLLTAALMVVVPRGKARGWRPEGG